LKNQNLSQKLSDLTDTDWKYEYMSNCELYNIDCLDLDPKIVSDCKLLYIDPPYGPENMDKYFGVGKNIEDYISWLDKRLRHVTQNMSDYNVVVQVDPKCGHYVKVAMDQIFGLKNFKNEITWCYSGPSVCKSHFPRKHDILYWYGVGKNVFNVQRIAYKSLSNAKGSPWGGISEEKRQKMLERGKMVEDFWTDIPALIRNEKEKRGYKTQKPKKLLDRLVSALSNEEDLVVDPMVGSGTTMVSALSLGRKFIGCDNSTDAIKLCEKTRKSLTT